MDVLLDNARDQLDFPTFVSHLEAGLSVRTWQELHYKFQMQGRQAGCRLRRVGFQMFHSVDGCAGCLACCS